MEEVKGVCMHRCRAEGQLPASMQVASILSMGWGGWAWRFCCVILYFRGSEFGLSEALLRSYWVDMGRRESLGIC
jgi:hypothetical protein